MTIFNGCAAFVLMILLPVLAGLIALACGKRGGALKTLAVIYAAAQLVIAAAVYFSGGTAAFTLPFTGEGFELRLMADGTSAAFLLITAAAFAFVSVWGAGVSARRGRAGKTMLVLYLGLALANGALLADNLDAMLFFWEGMLCLVFTGLLIGNKEHPKTAVKALVSWGVADLLMMAGIVLTVINAGTATISEIYALPLSGTGALGFAFLLTGAAGKAGCAPFHGWIADAAADGSPAFFAAFPALFGPVLGGYLASRLTRQMYDVSAGSAAGMIVMALGLAAAFAVLLPASVQKTPRRSLASLISGTAGLMVVGVGTCIPGSTGASGVLTAAAAIAAPCLFILISSAPDGQKPGRAALVCYIAAAASLCCIPPFFGFFPAQAVYGGARVSGLAFMLIAALSLFPAAAALTRMGRTVFAGNKTAAALRWYELIPAAALACGSLAAGILCLQGYAPLGTPQMLPLAVSMAAAAAGILCAALSRSESSAFGRVPVLGAYCRACADGRLDPYNGVIAAMRGFAWLCSGIEHGVSWFYDVLLARGAKKIGSALSHIDNGRLSRYIWLAAAGLVLVAVLLAAGAY